MPSYVDYSSPTTISSADTSFTAPENGVFTYKAASFSPGYPIVSIKIETNEIDGARSGAEYAGGYYPGKLLTIKKGQTVSFLRADNILFFPFEN